MATDKSITAKVDTVPERQVRFRFTDGDMSGQEVMVNRDVFFIGRSSNNNMVLDDRSVSRKQAVLNYIDGKYILSDLKSFKGTLVNGKKIQEVELKSGDRIQMGQIQFEFLEGNIKARFKAKKFVIAGIIIFALAIIASLFFMMQPENKVGSELQRQVQFNYRNGIRAYNVDKNPEAAKRYFEKVIELDVNNETVESKKAKVLLENIK